MLPTVLPTPLTVLSRASPRPPKNPAVGRDRVSCVKSDEGLEVLLTWHSVFIYGYYMGEKVDLQHGSRTVDIDLIIKEIEG